MVPGPVWLEPPSDDEAPALGPHGADPAAELAQRESVARALVGALQHLPGTQRAVLLRYAVEVGV